MTNSANLLIAVVIHAVFLLLFSFVPFESPTTKAILFAATYIAFTLWSIAFWIVTTLEERLPKHS